MPNQTEELLKLIGTLKSEHCEILRQIAEIEDSFPVDETALRRLIHFVRLEHHPKEEEVLFPAMAESKCLSQGGPLCGYFMGLRLDFDPLTQMRSHITAFCQKSGFQYVDHESPNWLSPQNPLSIPMEEHEVAHLLSLALVELMEPRDVDLKEEFFKPLLYDYFSLLKLHIQKEDGCLFIQCVNTCR